MRNERVLIIDQLDHKLRLFESASKIMVPEKGWLYSIRNSLNMTLAQLGERLGITRQGAKSIEDSEARGSVSINTLKDVAAALDMKLVYGFIPLDGSLDNLINRKSKELAYKIVMRTHQNMVLEEQQVSYEKLEQAKADLAEDLKREMKKSLWD